MIDALITSKTRIKLITRLFLNSNAKSHLRGLAGEFGESSNAIRLELNRFEKAGLLTTSLAGNKKNFQANTQHPLYTDIHNILLKHLGFDQIIQKIVEAVLDEMFRIGKVADAEFPAQRQLPVAKPGRAQQYHSSHSGWPAAKW